MNYKYLNTCLACNSKNLQKFLDLGNQPLANNYVTDCHKLQDKYPLALQYCNNCTHVQLTVQVDPKNLFDEYLYVSGTSSTGKEYFKNFVGITQKYVDNIENVLDIACNDGSQLSEYKTLGYNTFGIDPAKNLLPLSSLHGKICCGYASEETISSFGVKFDIIIAQNVFAHISYNKEFLEYCANNLSDTGAIFIQTSQANMLFNGEFDTVYHEHISFFNPQSMLTLANRAGLILTDILTTDIHGSSYIFILRKIGNNIDLSKYTTTTQDVIDQYKIKSQLISNLVPKILDTYRDQEYTIIGYGAAAKSNTFINVSKITLDVVIDDNYLKQGKYIPGTTIPIVSSEYLNNAPKKLLIVILSWNFYDEIKTKILNKLNNNNVVFLRYYPNLTIE